MKANTLLREISASPQEFERGIRAAFPDAESTATGWHLHWQTASAEIELTPMEDLVIASLRLPRQQCRVTLNGSNQESQQSLLDRLDRYQQRGGG